MFHNVAVAVDISIDHSLTAGVWNYWDILITRDYKLALYLDKDVYTLYIR